MTTLVLTTPAVLLSLSTNVFQDKTMGYQKSMRWAIKYGPGAGIIFLQLKNIFSHEKIAVNYILSISKSLMGIY